MTRSRSSKWKPGECDEWKWRHGILHRPLALHRLPGLHAGMRRVRYAPWCLHDPPETIMRLDSVQTAPQVCMHCEDPICAQVCPADAIKKTPEGVVQSSLKLRCIGCSNCVLACPFGVPKYKTEINQMMKCDMCYDRTSIGKRPMCPTVCPSGAF